MPALKLTALASLLLLVLACSVAPPAPPPTTPTDPGEGVCLVRTSGSLGTGMFISPTRVLTAKHVVDRNRAVIVLGQRVLRTTTHPQLDVAVLELREQLEVPFIEVGAPVEGPAEAYVYAGGRVFSFRVVLRLERSEAGLPFRGFTPQPGQSGSPIVQNGRVVGVVTQLDLPFGGYWERADVLVPPIPTDPKVIGPL